MNASARDAAVAALPAGPVRDAAAAPDYSPFPPSRAVWTDTPPIPGFAERGRGDAGAAARGAGAPSRGGAGRRR